VVFDLETTGLDSELNEIIEIGALKVDLQNNANTLSQLHANFFETLVKPSKKLPQKIISITGITDNMLNDLGEPLSKVLPEFLDFIGELPLVSYNSDFDMGFLHKAVSKICPDKKLNNKVSCALKMAREAWPNLQSYKLSYLSKLLELDNQNTHRALGDSKRALIIYVHAATVLNRA
jgi:DNA polymerase III epsilon subunit family exonuclease